MDYLQLYRLLYTNPLLRVRFAHLLSLYAFVVQIRDCTATCLVLLRGASRCVEVRLGAARGALRDASRCVEVRRGASRCVEVRRGVKLDASAQRSMDRWIGRSH